MKGSFSHLADHPGRVLIEVIAALVLVLAFVVPRGGAAGAVTVVTADGGTVSEGSVTLTVPAGAVLSPTEITVATASGLPDFDGTAPLAGFTIGTAAVDTGAAVAAFEPPAGLDVSLNGLDLTAIDPADLRLAALAVDGAWRVLATLASDGVVSASIHAPGTFAVVVDVPAQPVTLTFDHASDAPAEGRHRVGPGDELALHVGVRPDAKIGGAQLVESVPAGWTVVGARGGTWDEALRLITWDLGSVPAVANRSITFVARAPLVSPANGSPAFESSFGARLTYRGGAKAAADVTVLVAPRVVVAHDTLATIDSTSLEASYLPADAPILGAQRFDVFRVRFQLRNADTIPVKLTPRLEFRSSGAGAYAVVPEDVDVGVAFHMYREWTRPPELHGLSKQGPLSKEIAPEALRVRDTDDADQKAAPGHHSLEQNPAPAVTLGPLSYTEVEFSVEASIDADYLTTYDFRVTDEGAALPGAVTATVGVGAKPPLQLSPGQHQGTPVADPPVASGGAAIHTSASATPRYALLASVATQPAPAQRTLAAAAADPVVGTHGPFSAVADQCAICHVGHTGKNQNLLGKVAPQSVLCFSCHDGTGANSNVGAQYTDPNVPTNNAATRDYYRHDATVTSNHTKAQLDEFGGVLNRHAECGDCHNSHKARGTDSTQTASGWTASGRLANISGVSVVNGAAGTSPAYTFLNGDTTPAYEYQLCFKCHSGATTLPSNTGFKPSKYALDKGVELNPANASYHPVEAAGKNATQKMIDSLNGTSPYKLWNFGVGDTIRCSSCHASSTKYSQTPKTPAGSSLSSHTSKNRGILLQSYRDRVLKAKDQSYAAVDFAECFLCHGEAPFAPGGETAQTNFKYHQKHVGGIPDKGPGGTDIDTAGAGQGNAICAECHFRIHSTTYKDGTQTITGTRLVNFAPNVLASGGTRSWNSTGTGTGNCTLTCHGKSHTPKSY